MFASKLGRIFCLGYLGVFALSGVFAVYILVFDTGNSALCGVPAIVITQPWSLILLPLFDMMGYIHWYERFASTPAVYGLWAMLGLVPSAFLNAFLLYHLGWSFEKANARPQKS